MPLRRLLRLRCLAQEGRPPPRWRLRRNVRLQLLLHRHRRHHLRHRQPRRRHPRRTCGKCALARRSSVLLRASADRRLRRAGCTLSRLPRRERCRSQRTISSRSCSKVSWHSHAIDGRNLLRMMSWQTIKGGGSSRRAAARDGRLPTTSSWSRSPNPCPPRRLPPPDARDLLRRRRRRRRGRLRPLPARDRSRSVWVPGRPKSVRRRSRSCLGPATPTVWRASWPPNGPQPKREKSTVPRGRRPLLRPVGRPPLAEGGRRLRRDPSRRLRDRNQVRRRLRSDRELHRYLVEQEVEEGVCRVRWTSRRRWRSGLVGVEQRFRVQGIFVARKRFPHRSSASGERLRLPSPCTNACHGAWESWER